VVNFALNVLIVRATGAKLFGVHSLPSDLVTDTLPASSSQCAGSWPCAVAQVSAVPLALLLSTIQFLSREGVRGACQRIDILRAGQPPDAAATRADLARVVNLSWAVLPLAAGVAPLVAAATIWRGYDGINSEEYLDVVLIFGCAAVLELLVEPAYNLVVVCDKLHIRALVDGLAVTAKAVTIWVAVVRFELGVLAFAWGQAAYAIAQLCGLYGYAASRALAAGGMAQAEAEKQNVDFPLAALSQLLPAPLPSRSEAEGGLIERWFGVSAAAEASALWRQSLLKHLLTEADKLLLLAAGGSSSSGSADAVYGATKSPAAATY
jgi:hypothetical protein